MTIVKCDAPDCLNIDKKTMICTLDEIKYGRHCENYERDMVYLRRTWMYVPIYDDYAQGMTPVVELKEDENIRE